MNRVVKEKLEKAGKLKATGKAEAAKPSPAKSAKSSTTKPVPAPPGTTAS